jgi:hypothetical protein
MFSHARAWELYFYCEIILTKPNILFILVPLGWVNWKIDSDHTVFVQEILSWKIPSPNCDSLRMRMYQWGHLPRHRFSPLARICPKGSCQTKSSSSNEETSTGFPVDVFVCQVNVFDKIFLYEHNPGCMRMFLQSSPSRRHRERSGRWAGLIPAKNKRVHLKKVVY